MTATPSTQSGRIPEFIKGLISAIGYHHDVVPGWLCFFMQVRVQRLGNRIAALLGKLRAGTYRAPLPRVRAPEIKSRDHNPIAPSIASALPAGTRLPTRFA